MTEQQRNPGGERTPPPEPSVTYERASDTFVACSGDEKATFTREEFRSLLGHGEDLLRRADAMPRIEFRAVGDSFRLVNMPDGEINVTVTDAPDRYEVEVVVTTGETDGGCRVVASKPKLRVIDDADTPTPTQEAS